MLFNSFEFALFFPVAAVGYFFCPPRFRWLFLVASGYFFYMQWRAAYGLLLAATTLLAFAGGLAIERWPARRSLSLAVCLAAELGILFFFKYFNFAAANLSPLIHAAGLSWQPPLWHIALPIGISFFTFQTMSYLIDVYRGVTRAERHPGYFAAYVAFWPILLAGPIERAGSLLPQLKERHTFEYQRAAGGLKLMAWGLFKKIVIADRLSLLVNYLYDSPEKHPGPALAVAIIAFAYQLYCDFSGYSDIAIGAAQFMGFRLTENFRRPYLASSIAELWRRWHRSLTGWFRDYVYVPLGGNRTTPARHYTNIAIVFLLSGLWHGANWTFIVWGGLNAFYMICGSLWRPSARASRLGVVRTFLLFALALVFFRAATMRDAFAVFGGLASGWSLAFLSQCWANAEPVLGLSLTDLVIAMLGIFALHTVESLQENGPLRPRVQALPPLFRWSLYVATVLILFSFGIFKETQFLYLQF